MYLFFRKLLSIFFHIKYKINVIDPQNIPDLKGGYIIACNHQRYADPPMLAAVIRGKFSFIAKILSPSVLIGLISSILI